MSLLCTAHLRHGTPKRIGGDYPRTLWTAADGELVSTGTQEVEAGSRIPWHTHSAPEAEEVLTCLHGSGQILIGDEVHAFEPGVPWHIAKNVPHSVINGSIEASLWLSWTISPAMTVASLTQDSRAAGGVQQLANADDGTPFTARTVDVAAYNERGFIVVDGVFEHGEMESLGAVVDILASRRVAEIRAEAEAGRL
eukprot:COSAG01_NODE_26918_length_699_cov_1.285000_1_plen_195_part_01